MRYPRRVDVSLTGAFYEQFRGEFPRGLKIIPAPVVKAGAAQRFASQSIALMQI